MLPEDQRKAYEAFYNSARRNNILEPKTTLMIHLATAMAVSCYPWMESYLGVAREAGITEEEIGAVQSIVMAVSAGKINAQLNEVRSRTKATMPAAAPRPPQGGSWGSTGPAWRASRLEGAEWMSLTLWLSKNLSRAAKGTEGFEVEGRTVGECLNDLIGMEPGMKHALFCGSRLDPRIEVQVNGKTVHGPECLARNVNDGDEIRIVLRGHWWGGGAGGD